MKRTALSILSCITALLLCVNSFTAKAGNATGGEIIYEHLSDSTYRFFFKYYRNCDGSQPPTTILLCFNNPCTSTGFNVNMSIWPGIPNGEIIPTGCSQNPNKCQDANSTIPGVTIWWYYGVVTLPARCNAWRIYTYPDTRMPGNNIQNATSTPLYIETQFNNQDFQGNTTAYYSNKPLTYTCVNWPALYNAGAVDPNGDSLVTEIIHPLTGSFTNCAGTPTAVTYPSTTPPIILPYNAFQTNNSLSFNPATGSMSFTPTEVGPQALAIRTKEYRNGQFVGSTMRETQLNVMSCGNPDTVSFEYDSASFTNAGFIPNNMIISCKGQALSFCFSIESNNAAAKIYLTSNSGILPPGSSVNYTGMLSDSVRGCVTIPASANGGLYTLNIFYKDSTCTVVPKPLTTVKAIPILIAPKPVIFRDTTICHGDSVQLNVGGPGPTLAWSELPGGTQGSLSCTNCDSPLVKPSVTTQYMVTVAETAFCSPANKDTVTVNVIPVNIPSVAITASPDTNVWPGLAVTFTATATNCTNPIYQWQVNGNDISGANTATYATGTLSDMDVVTCRMTCNDTCSINASSNTITMHVATSVKNIGINKLNIYPNPNNGSFRLSGYSTESGIADIEVLNTLGQSVYKTAVQISSGNINASVDAGSLPTGIYTLSIRMGQTVHTSSFNIISR